MRPTSGAWRDIDSAVRIRIRPTTYQLRGVGTSELPSSNMARLAFGKTYYTPGFRLDQTFSGKFAETISQSLSWRALLTVLRDFADLDDGQFSWTGRVQ